MTNTEPLVFICVDEKEGGACSEEDEIFSGQKRSEGRDVLLLQAFGNCVKR